MKKCSTKLEEPSFYDFYDQYYSRTNNNEKIKNKKKLIKKSTFNSESSKTNSDYSQSKGIKLSNRITQNKTVDYEKKGLQRQNKTVKKLNNFNEKSTSRIRKRETHRFYLQTLAYEKFSKLKAIGVGEWSSCLINSNDQTEEKNRLNNNENSGLIKLNIRKNNDKISLNKREGIIRLKNEHKAINSKVRNQPLYDVSLKKHSLDYMRLSFFYQ